MIADPHAEYAALLSCRWSAKKKPPLPSFVFPFHTLQQ